MSAENRSGELAIEVVGLRMSYGATEVLHGIDLAVHVGELVAILGPNGAGKTTTVEILEGFRIGSAEKLSVLGTDPSHAGPSWRERVGVVLQSSVPEPDLTVMETLRLYAGFYERPAALDDLLAQCGLVEQAGMRNSRLSGGQQRRLDVALALVGQPEVLFLDEPTTGFDPAARRAAWDMIAGLRDLGTTVVLTTHYLEEAEFLADRIAVIDHGRIVAEGTPAELGGRDHAASEISFRRPEVAAPLPVEVEPTEGGRVRLVADNPTAVLAVLTAWAVEHGTELHDLDVSRPTLERTYLELTNSEAPS
jgi:ABC-2 type transport system ATP-binding protein